MTERTSFNPRSRRGEIRAKIATTLLNEMTKGGLTALIARSPDFYGPRVQTSVANRLVFDKLAQGAKASWLVNDMVRHSWTFTPDAGKSLALLAASDSAWNRTWHVPAAPNPPTGKQFIEIASEDAQHRTYTGEVIAPSRLALLAGATGLVGRELLSMLLASNRQSRAFFRARLHAAQSRYVAGHRHSVSRAAMSACQQFE